jgi:hypothetical protein
MKAKNRRDTCIAGTLKTEAMHNGNNGVNTWKRRDVNNIKIPATAEMPTTANTKSSREVSHSMETSNCRDCRCC